MVAPPLGDKPGSGTLPPTGPAAGLVQPRALRPALCSPLSSDQKRRRRHSDLWAAGQAGGGPGPRGATTPHGIGEQRRSPTAGGTVRNSGKASARCHGRGKQEQTEGRCPASGLSQEREQRPGRGWTWRPSGRAGSAGAR